MESSNRHSLRTLRVLGLTAASLLLGELAQAGEQAPHFVMTAYSNGQGGAALTSGHYEQALRQLRYSSVADGPYLGTRSNNRCVALALTKQWAAAHAACDQAVRDAQHDSDSGSVLATSSRQLMRQYIALALSNRAVLHWLSADTARAAADLRRAETLSPKASFVENNKSAFEYSQTAVARIDVAAK